MGNPQKNYGKNNKVYYLLFIRYYHVYYLLPEVKIGIAVVCMG